MKRYSFGTFLVDASNQEAFDLCNRVAALQPVPALPILLLAPPEGGKTHLLYSIANRVKSTRTGTAVGFVRAEAFPEAVQRLAADPGPIAQAPRAVFLVDDAEEFIDHIEALEAVVRVFLEHGHAVVVASKVPPEYLVNLTPGLREILAGGLQVRMGAYRTQSVAAGSHVPDVTADWTGLEDSSPPTREQRSTEAAQLRARLDELMNDLEHVRAELALRRATEEDVERYRNALEEMKSRYAHAQEALAALRRDHAARSTSSDVEQLASELAGERKARQQDREQLETLERSVSQLREALKESADQAAELEYLKRELAVRDQERQELAALQREHATLREELTRVQSQLNVAVAARDQALATLTEHEQALGQRQSELDAERDRKHVLLARARALLEQVETRRRSGQEDELAHNTLLDAVDRLTAERIPLVLEVGNVDGHQGADAPVREDSTREWASRCEQLEQAAAVAHERANATAVECMRLQTAMEQQSGQVRDLQQTVAALTAEKKRLLSEAKDGRAALENELRQLQEELAHAEHDHQELMNTLEEQRIELEMTRIALEARTEEQQNRDHAGAQLTAERDSARSALESIRAEHERLRGQHKAVQRRLETALAELDALRHEAASQVAAAHAQAGELERRLAAAQEHYHHSKHAGQTVAKDLHELEKRFLETAELVSRMSRKLTVAVDPDGTEAESAYLYALTRGEGSEGAQLPLEMAASEHPEETSNSAKPQGNPYDEEKFIPFKPADHKINRTV